MAPAPARDLPGARSEDVRRRNLAALLQYVHVHGPTPRSQLTTALGLNRSTIGGLTGDLVAAGLVRDEAGRAAGGGGRPSHVVSPESERVQVLAMDVGVTHLTVARVGLGGAVLSRRDTTWRRRAPTPRTVSAALARSGAEMLAECHPDTLLVGAGVAVPGMVRRVDGQVSHAPNLQWRDVPLAQRLSEALGLSVAVGNDADLGIRAEHVRGAAEGVQDAVYLAGHSGIGAGIFAGGVPLGGRTGYAGEVGHTLVNPGGQDCHCGATGCWETECGEERLFALAGRPPGGGIPGVREVVAAAAAGEVRAHNALLHVARWLGRGTANVVNLLNPEVVIMGGALEEIVVAAGDNVRAAFEAATLDAPRQQARIVAPRLGSDSTLLGAAELAFNPLLSDPMLELRRTAS